jgi:exodeoxyribonuclease V alpha subunit
LIDEFSGIGFVKADAIARSVGIESHAPKRIRAGIRYCLGLAAQRGHTYLPETVLTTESARILQVSKDETEYELDRLYSEGTIILDDSIDNRRSYLPYLYESEKKCAEQLYAIKTGTKKTCTTDVHSFIQQYQAFTGIELDPIQCDAVSAAVSGKITLITGGPGTGKTTIIKAIIYLLSLQGQNFALTAPTGRAAKRMSETCGYEAKTIHRLLEYGYQPHSGRTEYSEDPFLFFRGEDNPLDYDCVIIDELSMVDIPLMAQFLSAIRPETSLVFVGDADQLASVGPGNVLSDLLDSGYLHTVRLQTVFRQSNESLIITNAHRINEGLMPELDANKTDFLFVNAVSQQKIAAKIYGMIQNDDFDLLKMIHKDNVQLISPLKKGEAGVINLNQHLQRILNPRNGNPSEVDVPSYHLRKGDKVMQIRNDYSMPWRNIYTHQKGEGVYNGDMGFVREIDPIAKQLYVLFDNERMASYAFTEVSSLTLAYAITVHKSQGSEFSCVLIPVFSANPDFLTRNLIYTAVTRAKEKVILVGEKRVLYAMIQNNRTQKRYSGLRERLAGYEC